MYCEMQHCAVLRKGEWTWQFRWSIPTPGSESKCGKHVDNAMRSKNCEKTAVSVLGRCLVYFTVQVNTVSSITALQAYYLKPGIGEVNGPPYLSPKYYNNRLWTFYPLGNMDGGMVEYTKKYNIVRVLVNM